MIFLYPCVTPPVCGTGVINVDDKTIEILEEFAYFEPRSRGSDVGLTELLVWMCSLIPQSLVFILWLDSGKSGKFVTN